MNNKRGISIIVFVHNPKATIGGRNFQRIHKMPLGTSKVVGFPVKDNAVRNEIEGDGERYLTDREVVEILKVSRRTLQEYRNDGVLLYMKEINYKEMKFNPFNLIGGE